MGAVTRVPALAVCALLSASQVANAAPAEAEPVPAPSVGPKIGPKIAPKIAPVGTLSEQGTRRGEIQFGIAAVLTGTAIGIAAFGTVQYVRAREHVTFCNEAILIDPDGPTGIDPCVFDPPPLGFAAAGLSWGLSLPLLVGAGILFTRGSEIFRDARRYERNQVSLSPWWDRRGGGASLSLRF